MARQFRATVRHDTMLPIRSLVVQADDESEALDEFIEALQVEAELSRKGEPPVAERVAYVNSWDPNTANVDIQEIK